MIPNTALRVVESSGVSAVGEFGISEQDSAHIMTILRDTLYSDKILAVLREYSSNAWDSHRESGKQELPIKIHVATPLEPTLTIQDFGPGLSQSDVLQVYTKYGRSTKRGSDAMVGMLGIGSKSGFAYSDSFTVISRHGGVKRTFVAVLDVTEKGLINLLHEEPCGDETGVTIEIPVKAADMGEFNSRAAALFRYYEPRPNINIDLPPAPLAKAKLTHGVIYEKDGDYRYNREWVAVMGCVPYRINLDQLRPVNGSNAGIPEFLNSISGALYFKIGEVQINASREELKYSDETKAALIQKFNLLVEEYVTHALQAIETGGFSFWEKRLKATVLKELGLPVPVEAKELMEGSVGIKDSVPESMTITKMNRESCNSVTIDAHARLIIKDDSRPIAGFRLSQYDYLVRPAAKVKMDELLKDLNELIAKKNLTGIPVLKLSAMEWNTPRYGSNGRTLNPKHHTKSFVYTPGAGGSHCSSRWTSVERQPTANDVFVIINRFKTDFSFGEQYRSDRDLSKQFKGPEMPPVYGYKSTDKHPVKIENCLGKEYREWRKTITAALLTVEMKEQLESWAWANLLSSYHHYDNDKVRGQKARLLRHLAATHPLVVLYDKYYENKKKQYGNHNRYLSDFSVRAKAEGLITSYEADKALEEILTKYPLLKTLSNELSSVWNKEHGDNWLGYINLIDGNTNGGNTNDGTNPVHDEQ